MLWAIEGQYGVVVRCRQHTGDHAMPDMTRPSSISPVLLDRAVRATRDALHQMDEDEVPLALRRVAASSARRLPPPLLVTVLDFLDDAEWLRAAALERWPEADVDGSDARHAVSALFLARPPGWEERVSALMREVDAADSGRLLDESRQKIERLERLVEDLTERLHEARSAARRAAEEAETKGAAALTRWDEARRRSERRRAELEAELAAASSVIEARDRDLAEADARIDELRARIARRERASETGGAHGFGKGDPVELARDLDRLMAAVRPVGEGATDLGVFEPLRLPAGVRPDDPLAVEWLAQMATPVRVLVDGFNVAHEIASPPDAAVRRRVEDALIRLRRLSAAPINIVVFWDSSLGEERWPAGGLDIRYVPDADGAIAREVHADDRPTVVITSDRGIHDRARRQSVVVIWSLALVEWSKR